MEDHLAHAEGAFFLGSEPLLAGVSDAGLVDPAFFADRALLDDEGGSFLVEGLVTPDTAVTEVEGGFPFGPFAQGEFGFKGAAHFAFEAFDRADVPGLEEGADFLGFEFPAAHRFPDDEFALLVFAIVGFERLLESLAAPAAGAFRAEVMEVAAHGLAVDVAGGVFDFCDDAGHEVADFLHESVALEASGLHFLQLVFPLAGQFGRAKGVDLDFAQCGDEFDALGRGGEFSAFAADVLLGEEPFNDGCPGGGRAESSLAHGFAQFLVLNELARALHGGEEGAFVEAGGRLGLQLFDFDRLGGGRFSFFHRHERIVLLACGNFPVNFKPAGLTENLALGFEIFAFDCGDAFGHLEFGCRVEHSDEAARHEVVELHFVFVEFVRAGTGRDDGVVVADFGVVEDTRGRLDPVVDQRLAGVRGERRVVHPGEDFFRDRQVVGRQIARVGAGVGEDFVALVEGLGQLQGALGAEAEASVRLALEGSEIVEEGRSLGGRFAFFVHRAGLALALGLDFVGFGAVPEAFGLGILVG